MQRDLRATEKSRTPFDVECRTVGREVSLDPVRPLQAVEPQGIEEHGYHLLFINQLQVTGNDMMLQGRNFPA